MLLKHMYTRAHTHKWSNKREHLNYISHKAPDTIPMSWLVRNILSSLALTNEPATERNIQPVQIMRRKTALNWLCDVVTLLCEQQKSSICGWK